MNNEIAVLINTRLNDKSEVVISGRELHEFLDSKERFSKWFDKMSDYGFELDLDYTPYQMVHPQNMQEFTDYALKIDMAKEIAMIQRSEKGKQARQYFLELERKWNSPEMIMKRALEFANKQVEEMEKRLDNQLPKVLLAESIGDSNSLILIRELAKVINQSGYDIGEKRLFCWLRTNGYLVKKQGTDYNMPTQKSLDLKVLKLVEATRTDSKGIKITKTSKVTGKGQLFFTNKFLKELS